MSKRRIATNGGVGFTTAQLRQMAINIRRAEAAPHFPNWDGNHKHERICAVNDSAFIQSYFSEPLTNYAVGWPGNKTVENELEFLAPAVPVNRRFEYASDINAEAFLSELIDDERAIRGEFKEVEYGSTKINAKTANRGLMISIDLDEVADKSNWQQHYTQKLIARLRLSSLRRGIAILSAAATNTAKTWDTTAGKDPDQDVISEGVLAATASGTGFNRVFYGDTSWSKRGLAHRAQNTAGGFASASMTEDQLAGLFGVDGVMRSRSRYQSTASAKAEVVGNKVLMFDARSNLDTEDPSNIKRFISPVEGGGYLRVYVQQVSSKIVQITVEHYELIKITSTLGIRQFTVS